MHRREGGYWVVAVRLPVGFYRFRYCADGQWFCDFGAFGVEYDPAGSQSLLVIGHDPVRCLYRTA
jgi:hypothetical protein